MATHYKPSQWRGKRLVYKSLDPAEPRRETVKGVLFIGIAVVILAVACVLSL
jgi:hypothetical protein